MAEIAPEIRRWVETWKRAEPELEAIRRKEIRETDTVPALAQMEGLLNHATRTMPPRESSGLVEMQRTLMKLR